MSNLTVKWGLKCPPTWKNWGKKMGICKNCKYWEKKDVVEYDLSSKYTGYCNNPNFVYTEQENHCPINGLGYWDYEGYSASFETGEQFGCIHFDEKDKSI